eukprot:TRINITY_DN34237_c0_g2_i3.p1 TRINITY_DN34237_c0_g2~~TRINITY_DN34237_c0_g2_i3.p1  ORF type:complete len:405 (-),score=64.32 TRINITY_DN34237_c0_g2_i3:174-1388(-)
MKRLASQLLPIPLDAPSGPVVLRYLPNGQALHGEVDPMDPHAQAERCLLQTETGPKKKSRGEQAAAIQSEDEQRQAESRRREELELRQSALDSLRNAALVSELLLKTQWGEAATAAEKIRFLQLQASVPPPRPSSEIRRCIDRGDASSCAAASRLRAVSASLCEIKSHAEMEAVLQYLRNHWPLQKVGRLQYAVEVWDAGEVTEPALEEASTVGRREQGAARRQQHAKPDSPRREAYFAYLVATKRLGVCLTFPREFGRYVQWRHRLWMQITELSGAAATGLSTAVARVEAPVSRCDEALVPSSASRPEALHAALLEAREALVDLTVFQHLSKNAKDNLLPRGWHVLRSSSAEITFAVTVSTTSRLGEKAAGSDRTLHEAVIGIKIRYAPLKVVTSRLPTSKLM